MPPQILDDLTQEIRDTEGAEESATVLINGLPALIQSRIDQALAGGATAAQIQGFVDLKAEMGTKRQALIDAIAANPGT